MTYCVAIATNDGLVLCSDSRTNAGADMLYTHSKMHVFTPAPDRVFFLLSAGNLATTQSITMHIKDDMENPEITNLANCSKMLEAAKYISFLTRKELEQAQQDTSAAGVDTSVTLIFGGQIQGSDPSLFMMYSAGNFISESDETPFLQIGESKYGKPILDRIITRQTSLEDAARCALVSMDSTIKSNATVGPPIEVLIYQRDTFNTEHYVKLDEDDPYLLDLRHAWNDALKNAFGTLPLFHWENRSNSNLQIVTDQFNDSGQM
jgi:putative proteasome-type protease